MNDKFEELIDYLTDKFDFTTMDDKYEYETVEQAIKSSYKALEEKELANYQDEIKATIKELEKYKNKGYYSMFGNDWSSIGFCCGYVIFDSKFNYINFVIC